MPEIVPLLHKQEGRLLGEELRHHLTGDTRLTTQFAIAFAADRPVDCVALTRALNAAVARHAALRIAIVPAPHYDEALRQMYLRSFARTGTYVLGLYEQRLYAGAEVELRGRAWSGDDRELETIVRQECAMPLHLSSPPVLRATVIVGESRHLVLVNLSHLLVDMWAALLLHHEVAHAYAAFVAGSRWELPPVGRAGQKVGHSPVRK